MREDNKLETISNLFENKEIRSIWDSEKEDYYFSEYKLNIKFEFDVCQFIK